MRCPECLCVETKVIDSRPSDDELAIRRRRECLECHHRFTTYERFSESTALIIKSDGSSEGYNRQKLMHGILIACAKRPISPDDIEHLVDGIESDIRLKRNNQISSKELGTIVLEKLRALDDVAYIRFASVYKDFQTIEEFSEAIKDFSDNE